MANEIADSLLSDLPKTDSPADSRGLMEFIPWLTPGFESPWHLAPIIEAFERSLTQSVFCLISVPSQHGKDVADDTPVLTRRGWTIVGEVVVGDELIASDGGWTKVLALFPQGVVPLYRVTLTAGISIDAGAAHLWSVNELATTQTTTRLIGGWRIPTLPTQSERQIVSVDHVGMGPSTCFTVDAPDHLFAVGRDLVLTHNTETLSAGLVWRMMRRNQQRSAYVSYNIDRGKEVSVDIQKYATRAGLVWTGTQSKWGIETGASIAATGIQGGLTGKPIDGVMLIDDPHKDRDEAESPAKKKDVIDWFRSTAATRRHPGSSVFVVQTRWAPDDLIGTLQAEGGWEVINLPAIGKPDPETGKRVPTDGPDGTALWPTQRPLWFLREQQRILHPYEWQSIFQGDPQHRGDKHFGDITPLWVNLPPVVRIAFGVDLGYTQNTRADWSVAVKVALCSDGNFYILDVIRRQVEPEDFAAELDAIAAEHPGVSWRFYGNRSGEKGAARFIGRGIAGFHWMPTIHDKLVRALPTAALWRKGKILVPAEHRGWKDPFLHVVRNFTGAKGGKDDDVDALAAAVDELAAGAVVATYKDLPTLSIPRTIGVRGFFGR